MADVKNPDEPTLHIKRPTETTTTTTIPEPKKPKLHSPQNDVVTDQPNPQQQQPQQEQQEQVAKDDEEEEEQHQEEEEVNGKDVIDRKGKGILIEEDDDEEDEDGDDDDDSDSDSDSDSGIGDELSDGSDFADDPLAEVDLDNILPSRTRRKTIHPGVYLANDIPPEDSDDSDDPDA